MLLSLLLSTALGQTVSGGETPPLNAQLYRLPLDSQATLWTDDAGLDASGRVRMRLGTLYTDRPLSYVYESGERAGEETRLLGAVAQSELTGHVTAWRLRLGASVPVHLWSLGAGSSGGLGLGDASLDVKGVVLDREQAPLGLAVGARGSLPTNTSDLPLGTPTPTWALQLVVDRRFGDLLVAGNVGTSGLPRVELENVTLDDRAFARLGAGYALGSGGVSVDLVGHATYAPPLDAAAAVPVEGMVGGWYRVHDQLTFRGGLGSGLTPGIGASRFRAVLALEWAPERGSRDRDGDGLVDRVDACADEPEDLDTWEDHDGCPDPDNDGDGVVDVHDLCPLEPEDLDAWEDGDGCPDPAAEVSVRFLSPEGAPVDAYVSVLGPQTDLVTDGAFLELHPGLYQLTARADGFEEWRGRLLVQHLGGMQVEHVLTPVDSEEVSAAR